MRKITFDIETTSEAMGGNFDPAQMNLAIIGIHDSETGDYSCFSEEELPQLWPILERADIVIGYNSDHFDLPILNRYYPGNLMLIKSVDLLKEIKNVLGRRLRLDNIAEATLGKKKSGSGLQAVRWWKEGQYDLVRNYCLDDVRITKELYDYALKHKSLKYRDFDGVRDIKLDTSLWEAGPTMGAPALTHILPF